LARNRRSPKRPSEPRPSGAHPEEDEVGKDGIAFEEIAGWGCCLLGGTHEAHEQATRLKNVGLLQLTDSQPAVQLRY
jgi:hypothetical protein